MNCISELEDMTIEMNGLIESFKLLSELFEYKMYNDFMSIMKFDPQIFAEITSFQTLYVSLLKSFQELNKTYQNKIDLFYTKNN